MRCYFAHPVTDYGASERQLAAIAAIEAHGWTVESPDKPWHQDGYQARGMSYFMDIVADCDALAFLRFPSGSIGAGVGKEIETALTRGLQVFDIANGFAPVTMMPPELLTVVQTRDEITALRAHALTGNPREGGAS